MVESLSSALALVLATGTARGHTTRNKSVAGVMPPAPHANHPPVLLHTDRAPTAAGCANPWRTPSMRASAASENAVVTSSCSTHAPQASSRSLAHAGASAPNSAGRAVVLGATPGPDAFVRAATSRGVNTQLGNVIVGSNTLNAFSPGKTDTVVLSRVPTPTLRPHSR